MSTCVICDPTGSDETISKEKLCIVSGCLHKFHKECIEQWVLHVASTCPICRTQITFLEHCDPLSPSKVRRINICPRVLRQEEVEETSEDSSYSLSTNETNQTTFCDICHRGDREHVLLMCSRANCKGAAHCDCLSPPLSTVPEGDWFCGACTILGVHTTTRTALNYSTPPQNYARSPCLALRSDPRFPRCPSATIISTPILSDSLRPDSPLTNRTFSTSDEENLPVAEFVFINTRKKARVPKDDSLRVKASPLDKSSDTLEFSLGNQKSRPITIVDTPSQRRRAELDVPSRPPFLSIRTTMLGTREVNNDPYQSYEKTFPLKKKFSVYHFPCTPAPSMQFMTSVSSDIRDSFPSHPRPRSEWSAQPRVAGLAKDDLQPIQNVISRQSNEKHEHLTTAQVNHPSKTSTSILTPNSNISTFSPSFIPRYESYSRTPIQTSAREKFHLSPTQRHHCVTSSAPFSQKNDTVQHHQTNIFNLACPQLAREITDTLRNYVKDGIVTPQQAVHVTNNVLQIARNLRSSSESIQQVIQRELQTTLR